MLSGNNVKCNQRRLGQNLKLFLNVDWKKRGKQKKPQQGKNVTLTDCPLVLNRLSTNFSQII